MSEFKPIKGGNMNRAKTVGQHLIYSIAIFAATVSLVLPSFVFAAQATDRSVELTNSSYSAENVTYTVNFTASGQSAAGAFVVDFCANSPLIGQSCTAPSGLDATSAASQTSGFTDVTGSANKVVVAGSIGASSPVSVAIDGITNPNSTLPLYARIVSYDTKANASNYTSTNLGSGAVDQGAVAIAITETIGVSGTVLESLTFCVSGDEIDADCTNTTTPALVLGQGTPAVLAPGVLNTGNIYTQITTNASSGAVVRLKSNATDCGGLLRAGDPSACDIAPALDEDIDVNANEGKFGVKTAAATNTAGVSNAGGAFAPVTGSVYNSSTYAFNFSAGNSTGVTSTFGDPFLDTAGEPANNKNMVLTFGAMAGNNTPAGTYSTSLRLIATGKF